MTKSPTTETATVVDEEYHINLDAYEGTEPYIFVSYSHRDTKEVAQILRILDKRRYRFWYDDAMEVGEDFREELRSRIEKSSAMLLFISNSSMQSVYCGMEIVTAFKYDKKICPVYLNGDGHVEIPAALQMILGKLQHATNLDSEKYIEKLIDSLPIETMRSLQVEGTVLLQCKDGSPALSIPEGVTEIAAGAFKNCEKLQEIEIGNEVEIIHREAFRGCKSLHRVVLPKNVRKVGDSTFRDCISMTSLVVECPDVELGERAFENCASLVEITLNDGITEIYGGVFNSCKALERVCLPKKLTILGESAFADCANLRAITIPSGVTKLDDMVFNGCSKLSKVVLNEKLTKIGKNAFKDCVALGEIFIPQHVNSIGAGVFRGCTNLSIIEVDPKNKYYKTVDNVLFNKNKSKIYCYAANSNRSSYEIPDSVTNICNWAFYATPLKEIKIPDSVIEIGEGAFCNCNVLRELVIPDSVVRIDDSAFRGCTNLRRIVIPDSVVEFGWGVFSGCDNITVVCSKKSRAAAYCQSKQIKMEELR